MGRVRPDCELFGGRILSKERACQSGMARNEPPHNRLKGLSLLQDLLRVCCGFLSDLIERAASAARRLTESVAGP